MPRDHLCPSHVVTMPFTFLNASFQVCPGAALSSLAIAASLTVQPTHVNLLFCYFEG